MDGAKGIDLIHLALRTEFSFKKCYGFTKNIVHYSNGFSIGVADDNNTFAHLGHHKACKDAGVKAILGVRLMVIDKPIEKVKLFGPVYIFIAKNQAGLSELYQIVKVAHDQFYYHPRLFQSNLRRISNNIIVIATTFNMTNRIDYIGIDQTTPDVIAQWPEIPKVAICKNWYPDADDREVYQLHVGRRKMEAQTFPQHIMSEEEWLRLRGYAEAVKNTHLIAEQCESYDLPVADMVKYKGKITLRELCVSGARKRKINLSDPRYGERLDRELKLIDDKNFADYFLIVAQMTRTAKRKMLVGPSRGSSAGSLVCFLTEIAEVDPIRFDLLFERFVDVNRKDLPDIDIDFPDKKRAVVIKSLTAIYGEDHVSHIATVSTMKPKSSIGEFAVELGIPEYETDAVKLAIVERPLGHDRSMMRVQDTFNDTEVGQEFIKKYPEMKIVYKIEGHARHSGVHAAGIIVCNDKLTKYGGVNSRDGALMMDYRDAEKLNLLKIDCLGLKTLSVLESVADQIGMKYSDYYDLPLDDKATLDIFNSLRLSGIFQFQGHALQYVTRQMGVQNFDDICAITALARPGPIHSGGTNAFIACRNGDDPIRYISKHPSVIKYTEGTYGVIVYQEQLMSIAREYGNLSWSDVSALRKAMSKSLGESVLNEYRDKFIAGAIENGDNEQEADNVWQSIVTFGSYGFNKSHAYGYGIISYWTAWAKAHHPLEFALANLNNAKREDHAIKILRDLVKNDGIEYTAFDPDKSVERWSIQDGKLLGGLLSLKGIGPKKAKAILKCRDGLEDYKPSMVHMLMNPDTPFTILFPCEHWWGGFFNDPKEFGLEEPPVTIETIVGTGTYLFVGKMLDRNIRNLNESQLLARRGGRYITDHTLFLNLIMEDDTDSIVATVNRYAYESMGRDIAETGKVGEDWYLIKGRIHDKWRRIEIDQILNLNVWGKQNNLGPEA